MKIFIVSAVVALVVMLMWLYLEGEITLVPTNRECEPGIQYEEGYSKSYADRVREVLRGCI